MQNIAGEATQMELLSKKFSDSGGEVVELQSRLQRIIDDTVGSVWQGNAATNFRSAWDEQFNGALTNLSSALQEASGEVDRRMRALIVADS